MSPESSQYQWTRKDKWLYLLAMVPFLVVFIGALLLLFTYSPWLAVLELVFYLASCVFQAGCCIGCPYRGKYCPALFGIYFGNLLSGILYSKREFDQKFFDKNAAAGEIMILLTAVFPLYWVVQTSWWLLPVYLLLIAAHLVLFMPTQCEKCSYNETCPGGIAWRVCSAWLRGKGGTYLEQSDHEQDRKA